MAFYQLVEYADASPEVKEVYDDIMAHRGTNDVNNFWKCVAAHPQTLRDTWHSVKTVMGDGALDPLTKQMIYMAVSIANACAYCTASHTAAAQAAGMTPEMFGELQAVIALANSTNRLALGYDVPIDVQYRMA